MLRMSREEKERLDREANEAVIEIHEIATKAFGYDPLVAERAKLDPLPKAELDRRLAESQPELSELFRKVGISSVFADGRPKTPTAKA